MGNCDPCSPSSSGSSSYSLVEKVRYLLGINKRGKTQALQSKPHSVVVGQGGDYPIVFKDGSVSERISLKNLLAQSVAAKTILVQDHSGNLYALIPATNGGGKKQLVHDGNLLSWESISANKALFNKGDIPASSGCQFKLAIIQECGRADGMVQLAMLEEDEIAEIFGCRSDLGTTEMSSLIGCKDGVPHHFTFPIDVNGRKIPGVWARGQDGNVVFIPIPVDPVSGLAKANHTFRTHPTPVAGAANLPSFQEEVDPPPSIGFAFINSLVAIPTLNFNLPSGPAGYQVELEASLFGGENSPSTFVFAKWIGVAIQGFNMLVAFLKSPSGKLVMAWLPVAVRFVREVDSKASAMPEKPSGAVKFQIAKDALIRYYNENRLPIPADSELHKLIEIAHGYIRQADE